MPRLRWESRATVVIRNYETAPWPQASGRNSILRGSGEENNRTNLTGGRSYSIRMEFPKLNSIRMSIPRQDPTHLQAIGQASNGPELTLNCSTISVGRLYFLIRLAVPLRWATCARNHQIRRWEKSASGSDSIPVRSQESHSSGLPLDSREWSDTGCPRVEPDPGGSKQSCWASCARGLSSLGAETRANGQEYARSSPSRRRRRGCSPSRPSLDPRYPDEPRGSCPRIAGETWRR